MPVSASKLDVYQEGWKKIWAKPVGRLLSLPKNATKIIIGHHKRQPNSLTTLVYVPQHQIEVIIQDVKISIMVPNLYIGIRSLYQLRFTFNPLANFIFEFYKTDNENSLSLNLLATTEAKICTSFSNALKELPNLLPNLLKSPKHMRCPTAKHVCHYKQLSHVDPKVCKRKVGHSSPCACQIYHVDSCIHRACYCRCICDCCLSKCQCVCNCICCRGSCSCSCRCVNLLKEYHEQYFPAGASFDASSFFTNFEITGSSDQPDALYLSTSEIGLAWNTYKENWLVRTSKGVSYDLLYSQFSHDVWIN